METNIDEKIVCLGEYIQKAIQQTMEYGDTARGSAYNDIANVLLKEKIRLENILRRSELRK